MNTIERVDETDLGGRRVRRMGFGAMQLAGPGVFGPPRDREAAIAVLRRAVELGVNHIDTSQYYGPTVVNELIRDALYPYPDDLALVTKVGARRDEEGRWLQANSPAELQAGVEDNLRTLRVERVHVVNLRIVGVEGSGVPRPDQLAALEELRRAGTIGHIGVSNVTLEGLELALEHVEVAEVQNAYSVLDRANEPLVDRCAELGIPFVAYFPLGSAFTGGPARLAAAPAVPAVAQRHGATPAQVALAWLLARYDRMLLIPGTQSVAHLEENVAAADLTLTGDDLEWIG
jgi:aryl-alcohol dehydrogenase-like predicted oxidoreductase